MLANNNNKTNIRPGQTGAGRLFNENNNMKKDKIKSLHMKSNILINIKT